MNSKLFLWILILGGIGGAIFGFVKASGPTESQPTKVSIADLEADKKIDAKWLEVTGGYLYWDESVQYYEEEEGGGNRKILGYYTPLVSKTVADTWEAAAVSEAPLSYKRCRMLVYSKVKSGDGIAAFTAKGLCSPCIGLTSTVKKSVREGVINIAWGKMRLLRQGEAPMQRGTAFAIAGGGVVAFLLGAGLIFRQRKQAAGPAASSVGGPMHAHRAGPVMPSAAPYDSAGEEPPPDEIA